MQQAVFPVGDEFADDHREHDLGHEAELPERPTHVGHASEEPDGAIDRGIDDHRHEIRVRDVERDPAPELPLAGRRRTPRLERPEPDRLRDAEARPGGEQGEEHPEHGGRRLSCSRT